VKICPSFWQPVKGRRVFGKSEDPHRGGPQVMNERAPGTPVPSGKAEISSLFIADVKVSIFNGK
jgi:hypothetical protein